MSLILAAGFVDGIVLASDSFVFDNDGEMPSKALQFDKILVSDRHRVALMAVGSRWVFSEAFRWLSEEDPVDAYLDALAARWSALNREWKANRKQEIDTEGRGTLRPVSDSLLVLARSEAADQIIVIDPEGNLHKSSTHVVSGSSADIVHHFLEHTGKRFQPADTLEENLHLVRECFDVGSSDLYVTGFPAIAMVTAAGVTELTKQCEQHYRETRNLYFEELARSAQAAIDNLS